jgi:hypothetical protein
MPYNPPSSPPADSINKFGSPKAIVANYPNNKSRRLIMTNTQKIAAIDQRIALLQSRDGKDNGNIINKLLREKRKLTAAE